MTVSILAQVLVCALSLSVKPWWPFRGFNSCPGWGFWISKFGDYGNTFNPKGLGSAQNSFPGGFIINGHRGKTKLSISMFFRNSYFRKSPDVFLSWCNKVFSNVNIFCDSPKEESGLFSSPPSGKVSMAVCLFTLADFVSNTTNTNTSNRGCYGKADVGNLASYAL